MEDINGSGGAPQGSGGTDQEVDPQNQQTNKPEGMVAYETFKKAVDEKKKLADRLAQLEAEKAAREKEALEKQGEYQKLYESTKSELEKAKEERRKEKNFFVYKTIADQFKAAAASAGCTRLDALEKLVDLGELAGEVDDDLTVKPAALKALIEKSQKDFDFLFAKEAPSVKDKPPGGGKPAGDLTYEEWLKLPLNEKKSRLHEVREAEKKKK